jgi:hypothetical protein
MTTAISAPPLATTHRETPVRLGKLGGVAGLVCAGSVLVQNGLRATFPANDVNAAEVMKYYTDHRGVTLALAVLMPLGLVGLTTFLGAVLSRVALGAGRAPAVAGAFGAAGIIATFTMLAALDVAIAGYVHRGAADVAVVDGMWVTHNAVFRPPPGIDRRRARRADTRCDRDRSAVHTLERRWTRRWRPARRRRHDHPGHH